VGWLGLAREATDFSDDDLGFVTTIAEMARLTALGWERDRPANVEHTARRTRHLASLVSVASTIGTTLDLDTVLKEILRAVSGVMGCQRTVIFELDTMSNLLNLVAADGISERYWKQSQGVPVTVGGRGHAIAANEMVVSSDVMVESRALAIAPLATEEGFRAFADLPLRRGDEPVGLLSVQFTDPHHFTDDELNLLRILAEQAAVAIENARLYTQTDVELRRRLAAMEALQRVTQEITSTIDLDYILDEVLSEAVRFCNGDAGLIAIFENQEMLLRASLGYEDENTLVRGSKNEITPDSPLMEFFERKESVYINDVQVLSDVNGYPPNARALFITPVFYEQQLVAAILVQSCQPDVFATAEFEFVEGLAIQTSIAIGNTRRYQEQVLRGELIHRRAEQMSLLLEASRTMRSDRALEDILSDVAYAVQEGTGFNIVLISVLEGSYLRRVAGAGIPLADMQRMKNVRHAWSRISALFREEFRLGQCYYF
jgi:GAF domain-containing protein